jgi:tRNA(Ile)-lysidine synthase
MFGRGSRVGVAVSGGPDSVCLLHFLADLAGQWDLRLTVLHVDHGLRGEESRADARFVCELAARFGIPYLACEAALSSGENIEQAARDARRAFFRQAMREIPLDCVATGHTRSDQAETVLFRFLRGAGSAGLAGIRPVTQERIVRPLIETGREEVESFLRARGISWREDSTNSSFQFARNRIRRELLPQLEREWNPALRETLAQTAEWACAEEEYWNTEIGRIAAQSFTERNGFVFVRTHSLRPLPLAAARRVVRRAIEQTKGDLRGIEFIHVEAVLAMAASSEGHGRVQVPGLDIFRSFEWLRFARQGADSPTARDYSAPADVPGVVRAPGGGIEISLELIEKAETSTGSPYVYNSGVGCIDRDRLSGSLILRNWRPGDQYQPAGSPREEKIKTLFQQARIPIWERRHWPVLTDASGIVWTRRFGAAARCSANSRSTMVVRVRESEAHGSASIK